MNCERCGAALNPDRAVWLELNCFTGRWSDPEKTALPQEKSQGVFPFGADCARQALKEKP